MARKAGLNTPQKRHETAAPSPTGTAMAGRNWGLVARKRVLSLPIASHYHKNGDEDERRVEHPVHYEGPRRDLFDPHGEEVEPQGGRDGDYAARQHRQVQCPGRKEYAEGWKEAALEDHRASDVAYGHRVLALPYPEDAVDLLRKLCGNGHYEKRQGYDRYTEDLREVLYSAHEALRADDYEAEAHEELQDDYAHVVFQYFPEIKSFAFLCGVPVLYERRARLYRLKDI